MGQQQAKEWKEAGMWADMAACQGQLDCLTSTNKNTMSECPAPGHEVICLHCGAEKE